MKSIGDSAETISGIGSLIQSKNESLLQTEKMAQSLKQVNKLEEIEEDSETLQRCSLDLFSLMPVNMRIQSSGQDKYSSMKLMTNKNNQNEKESVVMSCILLDLDNFVKETESVDYELENKDQEDNFQNIESINYNDDNILEQNKEQKNIKSKKSSKAKLMKDLKRGNQLRSRQSNKIKSIQKNALKGRGTIQSKKSQISKRSPKEQLQQ